MKLAIKPAGGWTAATKAHFSNPDLYGDADANQMYQLLLGENKAETPVQYFDSSVAAWSTNVYLCSTNDDHQTPEEAAAAAKRAAAIADGHVAGTDFPDSQITNAEAGKYIIYYHVEDANGNPECNPTSRTVIVKDTLPPVIALHLQPASPSLMAEQVQNTQDHSWVFGAAAAAITGVALFAHSLFTRPRTTVVSVPV